MPPVPQGLPLRIQCAGRLFTSDPQSPRRNCRTLSST